MNDTFTITQAVLEGILEDIRTEIKEMARIYDSKDLFGVAYGKFADKIIENAIDKYLE